MGADLYLESIWNPFESDLEKRIEKLLPATIPRDVQAIMDAANRVFDEMRASGGYYRNGYNTGDVMWAMGLSWPGTVSPMLDKDRRLPIKQARELIAMIEARLFTKEYLTAFFLENMTNGDDPRPF